MFKVLKLKLKLKKVFLFITVILLIYGIAYFCGFKISFSILKTVAFWSIGLLIILYSQEIRHALESGLNNNSANSAFSTEEEKAQVININLGKDLKKIRIIPISDIHIGDKLSDYKLLKEVLQTIKDEPDVYTILNGDLCNTALKNSKSDVYADELGLEPHGCSGIRPCCGCNIISTDLNRLGICMSQALRHSSTEMAY